MRTKWASAKIGDLLRIQNGFAFDSKKFSDSKGMPLIRIRDLKAGRDTETKYSGSFDKRYEAKTGDFLIGMDGEFGCYEWKGGKALLNQRVCRLQEFSERLEPKFLFYGINKYLKDIEDATTYTTVKHISSRQISNIDIPLPSRSEQQRIVVILDEAFAGLATATANAEKNLKNARELFDSYLNSVFAQKSESWKERRLGEVVASINTGPFGSLLHKSDYVDGGTPIVNPINIVGGTIVPDASKTISVETVKRLSTYKLSKHDMVVARRGEIGRCAVVQTEQAGWLCGTGCFFIKTGGAVNANFLAHLLRSVDHSKRLERVATGTTMKNLSNTALQDFEVSLPSLSEQDRLEEVFNKIFEETQRAADAYRRKLVFLDALKQAILQKAFSGELTSPPSSAIIEAAE